MIGKWLASACAALCAIASPAWAQEAYVRVVDVGAGLCVIAHTPDGYDFLYDAGFRGGYCAQAVEEIVEDDHIELIILSHSDADHIGELDEILGANTAHTIIHTGSERDTVAYREAMGAIGRAAAAGSTIINLANTPDDDEDGISDEIGSVYELGDARVEILAGWRQWDLDLSDPGRLPNESERRNAISIVVRLIYRGHSVLLTGDTIGRRIEDEPDACRDAERWMTRPGAPPLRSDVLIAPHHGANNGGSACFLAAVDPGYVIFSAGHDHAHPREEAALRARAQGVPWRAMFRTDRGDDERDPDHNEPHEREWGRGRVSGNVDPPGDNNVEICLGASVRVRYRDRRAWCGQAGAQD
jgi:beta-lactamase superfamily II metal-dependent hydrolase